MRNRQVTYMVCPTCARMHGQEHAAGCPQSFDAEPAYVTGWVAARDALVPPLCDEIAKLRDARSA